jgi:hypothetical protein
VIEVNRRTAPGGTWAQYRDGEAYFVEDRNVERAPARR